MLCQLKTLINIVQQKNKYVIIKWVKKMLKDILDKIENREKKEIPSRILEEKRAHTKNIVSNVIFIIIFISIIIMLIKAIGYDIDLGNKKEEYASRVQSSLQTGPIQRNFKDDEKETIDFKGVKITKLATYDITGVVVAMEFFYFGGGANTISEQDLSLTWGPAASSKYRDEIQTIFGANDRVAFFRFGENYYSKYKEKAITYVSNNHIIPMNNQVKTELKKVKMGDTVEMLGWLVYCKGNNWHWGPSSMVRNDEGCEIILTEYLGIK